jgi:hypothetical protein
MSKMIVSYLVYKSFVCVYLISMSEPNWLILIKFGMNNMPLKANQTLEMLISYNN